jgi:hypothetical protein
MRNYCDAKLKLLPSPISFRLFPLIELCNAQSKKNFEHILHQQELLPCIRNPLSGTRVYPLISMVSYFTLIKLNNNAVIQTYLVATSIICRNSMNFKHDCRLTPSRQDNRPIAITRNYRQNMSPLYPN